MSEYNIADSVTDEAFDASLTDDAPQDVQTAADQPASSGESVETAHDVAQVEEPKEGEAPQGDEKPDDATPPPAEDGQETKAEIQNDWKTAPEPFREQYNLVKSQLQEAQANSLREKFFEDPEQFLDELNGLSTSQFQQTTQQIVKRGIEAMPEDFANYLAEVAPDAVAKTLAGLKPETLANALDLGMPIEKARKIIAQVKAQELENYLNDNDETKTDEPAPKPAPKAKGEEIFTREDVERLVAEKVAAAGKPQQVEALEARTLSDVMGPVESMLKDAGLAPLPTDSPEEKQWKEWAHNQVIKDTLEHLYQDPKNKPRAEKMNSMLNSLDEAGVKHLATQAKIIAEDYAGGVIQMLTQNRATAKTKTTSAPKQPKPHVPSGAPVFGSPAAVSGRISEISESEFEKAGM